MYNYRGFGLHIASEIEFPELLPVISAPADVTISIGEIPATVINKASQGYIINEDELFFSVKDTASYYAAHGREIIISPDAENYDMRNIRIFLLATAMSAILLQRNLLPLHASAIIENGELILISGRSGAGKSTATAGLSKMGYTIFSDDITVLQTEDNRITGTASYPMIRLWEDTLQALDVNDRSFRVKKGLDKYGIFFHDDFNHDQYPVKKILLLDIGDELSSKKLSGTAAFEALSNQVYRQQLLQGPLLRSLGFEIISQLLQQVEVYHIYRPMHCKPESLLSLISTLI
jgi:predicted ATPase